MTTSATQPGVQTETTATTTAATGADASAQTTTAADATTAAATTTNTEPVLTARESVMEQITRQNEERLAAEYAAEGLPAPNAPVAATTTTTQPDDQLATQLEADKPTVLAEGLDKVMVRRKIDGVESEVSVAELLRDHQKHGAADKRLDEAGRLLREAQAQAAAIKANPPVGVDPNAPAKDITTQPQPNGEDPKAVAKKIVTALFEGDEATALEVVEQLVAGRQAPTQPDTRQLVDQIAPAVKQQLSDESALEKFSQDYKDIVADPYLATLADTFLEAEVKDPTKSYAQALEAAGKKTRDWLAAKTGTPATTTTPTIDRTQKLERKEGIDNVQSLNTKATTVEEPVQSHSDVIADMKKQRGLA